MNHYTIEIQARTKNLAINLIKELKSVKINFLNHNIVSQVLRSSTSIGANYNEALECESRDDFIHKLSICKKEANETIYWLNLLAETNPDVTSKINQLSQESMELVKIFAATIASTKRNMLK